MFSMENDSELVVNALGRARARVERELKLRQTELGQNDTSGGWGIIRQLSVWGRCDKRNWGNMSAGLSRVSDRLPFGAAEEGHQS